MKYGALVGKGGSETQKLLGGQQGVRLEWKAEQRCVVGNPIGERSGTVYEKRGKERGKVNSSVKIARGRGRTSVMMLYAAEGGERDKERLTQSVRRESKEICMDGVSKGFKNRLACWGKKLHWRGHVKRSNRTGGNRRLLWKVIIARQESSE